MSGNSRLPRISGSGQRQTTVRVSQSPFGAIIAAPGAALGSIDRPRLSRLAAPRFRWSAPPGIVPFAWPALVTLGCVIGLAIQMALVEREHLSQLAGLAVTLVAIALGSVGAKIWFLVLHHRPWTHFISSGMCIQGFVSGAACAAIVTLSLVHLPLGPFADAAAPAMFFGMGVGRLGCFFGGCCAGRPTASRWGIWASDGRVGTRRIPTQILESSAGLAVGCVGLVLQLQHVLMPPGALFVASLAAYTLCRQLILPLRVEPRKTPIGLPLTIGGAAIVLIATLAISTVLRSASG